MVLGVQTGLELAWLFLPGIVANLSPVFAAHLLPHRALPLWENGLGKNKTWRGVIVGLGAALAVGAFQYLAGGLEHVQLLSLMPVTSLSAALVMALTLGLAALLGDAIESFIKRRRGVAPGESWMPWDQIDYAIGLVIASGFFVTLSLAQIIFAVVLLGVGSFVTSFIGVTIGIKHSL